MIAFTFRLSSDIISNFITAPSFLLPYYLRLTPVTLSEIRSSLLLPELFTPKNQNLLPTSLQKSKPQVELVSVPNMFQVLSTPQSLKSHHSLIFMPLLPLYFVLSISYSSLIP